MITHSTSPSPSLQKLYSCASPPTPLSAAENADPLPRNRRRPPHQPGVRSRSRPLSLPPRHRQQPARHSPLHSNLLKHLPPTSGPFPRHHHRPLRRTPPLLPLRWHPTPPLLGWPPRAAMPRRRRTAGR